MGHVLYKEMQQNLPKDQEIKMQEISVIELSQELKHGKVSSQNECMISYLIFIVHSLA